MKKVCCAIAGNWSCGENGEWSFDVDKGRLGRLVSISEKSTLSEVCVSVALAFGESNVKTSLSFFNTSFGNTDVGSKKPPFLIETDCGVRNFFKLLLDRSDRNQMVTFSKLDAASSFKTPSNEHNKNCGSRRQAVDGGQVGGFLSTGGICGPTKRAAEKDITSVDEERLLFGEEMEVAEECMRSNGQICKKGEKSEDLRKPLNVENMEKSGGSSSEDGLFSRGAKRKSCVENCTVSDEDEGFLSEVSAVFELFDSKGKGTRGSEEQEKRFTLVDEDEVDVAEKVFSNKGKGVRTSPSFNLMNDYDFAEDTEAEEFGPRGFENEFGEATVGVDKGHPAFEYECRTNSVFDDVIRVGPPEEWKGYPKVEKGCGSSNMKPLFCDRSSGNFSSGNGGHGAFVRNTSDKRVDVDMNDVVDEESDVEPLFDDLTSVRLETQDVVVEEADDELFVGKTFRNKLECQTALAIYGIKKMFYFKQTRSNKDYIVVNCADSSCGWRVSAYKLKDCGYYSIKKAELEHTCSIETRSQYTKLANHRVIAAMYKPKFITKESGPRPMDLQQILLEELRVPSSYTKCWKAREAANAQNQGTEEESYLDLLQYLHMLKISNPGTVADVETEDDGLGGERFLYLFLSFGASIQGFKYLRRVIVLDGAHLGGKYQGVMLTASGQDANFQVFPLAFVVVDSENEASWTWFLRKFSRIIGDSPTLTIISDRARSILKAV